MPFADHNHALQHRRAYQRSEQGRARHAAACKAWRARNRKRLAAHNAVAKALMRGRMTPLPCFVCGATPAQAHHPDYDAPLDVVWLCEPHHKAVHREHRLLVAGAPENPIP